MLAGLLFATQDAEDRDGALAATLPFAGLTLIEYQARLLIGAGATQIIIVVARLTPELLGAIARIGRRGVAVDSVRTAAEAAATLHPLARVLMLADSLITTEAAVAPVAGEGRDTLVVLAEGDSAPDFERIDSATLWAGIARIDPARLAEVAAMPRDYDVQSALVRAAAQAGAARVTLPSGDVRAGHGLERRAATLEARGQTVMAATLAGARSWFDRWIVAPVARPLLGEMLNRSLPTVALAGAAAALAAGGLAGVSYGFAGAGVIATLLAAIGSVAGLRLAELRDEAGLAKGLAIATLALPALAALVLGHAVDALTGDIVARMTAVALVALAGLAERAIVPRNRKLWWGSPVAYLGIVASGAAAGWPVAALGAGALYAAVTLAAAIEALRRDA